MLNLCYLYLLTYTGVQHEFHSNMVGVTCGAGTADYSRAPEFTPVHSGVRVARSLVFCFVDRCLSFWPFSFGHRIICPSIYGFPLPFCYLQTILSFNRFLIPNNVFRQLYRSDRKKFNKVLKSSDKR